MENEVIQNQKREKTELILRNIFKLSPIPTVIHEILRLLENPTTTTSELNKTISKDQSLVAKILSIANSPLYGLQRKVSSLDLAILVLGFSEIKNIVSVLSMVETFVNKTDKYLDKKEFWMHSFMTGTAAKRLSDDLDLPLRGESFIAGFLHDMGLSVMHRYLHSGFVEIYGLVESSEMNIEEAEEHVLGMTHAEIGHFLMDRWNFPPLLSDAVLYHHNPALADKAKVIASIIHIADFMTQKLQKGHFYWDKNLQLNIEALATLGFKDEDELNQFIQGYDSIFEEQLNAMRIIN